MTDPIDSSEQITTVESEVTADDRAARRNGRVSLLFVALTFVAALAIGMAIGYGLGRSQGGQPVRVVVTATPGEAVVQANSGPAQSTEQPDAATGPDSAATGAAPTIMDFVLSDARHFQGEADAPITMVEFSDFK